MERRLAPISSILAAVAVEDREIREALAAARHVLAGHGAVLVLALRAHPIHEAVPRRLLFVVDGDVARARLRRRRRRRRAARHGFVSWAAPRSLFCLRLGSALRSLQLRRRQKLLRSEADSSKMKL